MLSWLCDKSWLCFLLVFFFVVVVVLFLFFNLMYVYMCGRIHVVFGRVVSGSQFVTEVENQKVDAGHRPYADIRITHSGELVLLKKS